MNKPAKPLGLILLCAAYAWFFSQAASARFRPQPASTSIQLVELSRLERLNRGCLQADDLGSVACNAAINLLCQQDGFATGFGPLDYTEDQVKIACLAAEDAAVIRSWTFTRLASTYQQPTCSQTASFSLPCLAAMTRACRDLGYAGGWGPINQANDNVEFFCTKSHSPVASTPTAQYFDALRFYDNAYCDTPFAPLSPACLSAVHHACQDHGYLTGYGPVGYDESEDKDLAICMGPQRTTPRPFLGETIRAMRSFNQPASQVATKVDALSTDNPADPGASQVYSRPLGTLTFSRASDITGVAPCTGANNCFGLTAAALNLATGEASQFRNVFTPAPGGTTVGDLYQPEGSLITAYDSFAMYYAGQTWVAFECNGSVTHNTFSACMGVYDPSQDAIDPASIYVLVEGTSTPEAASFGGISVPVTYTASVPKLLRDRGHIYLYWSVITVGPTTRNSAGKPIFNFLSVASRGVELKQNADQMNRLMPVDAAGDFIPGHLSAVDPRTVVVFEPPDPRGAADISDVVSDGSRVYSLASIGYINGCTSPYDTAATTYPPLTQPPISGADWPVKCYDPATSITTEPLTPGAFNSYKILLPLSGGYMRYFALSPDSGSSILLGLFGNFPWATTLKVLPSQNAELPLPFDFQP